MFDLTMVKQFLWDDFRVELYSNKKFRIVLI